MLSRVSASTAIGPERAARVLAAGMRDVAQTGAQFLGGLAGGSGLSGPVEGIGRLAEHPAAQRRRGRVQRVGRSPGRIGRGRIKRSTLESRHITRQQAIPRTAGTVPILSAICPCLAPARVL